MLRYSTALAQYLLQGGSIKQALHDGVIEIYAGTQPASADSAPGALKLLRITYQSGAYSVASTSRIDTATITYGVDGDVYALVINGTTYSYTSVNGDNASKVATALAAKVNASGVVEAVANSNVIIVRARYAGVDYTIANTGTTTVGNNVLANPVASARGNGLQFGAVTGNVLAKEAGEWSGVGLTDGLATWARFKGNPSSDDDSTSTSFIRMDMAINSANSEMLALTSQNVVTGGPQTVTAMNLTQPQQ